MSKLLLEGIATNRFEDAFMFIGVSVITTLKVIEFGILIFTEVILK